MTDVLFRAISRPIDETSINFTYESGDERGAPPFREYMLEPRSTVIVSRPEALLNDKLSINSLACSLFPLPLPPVGDIEYMEFVEHVDSDRVNIAVSDEREFALCSHRIVRCISCFTFFFQFFQCKPFE